LAPGLNIVPVPNGVTIGTEPPSFSERTDSVAVFHGTMDYPPNEQSALFIAREIAPRAPGVRFDIVGRGNSTILNRLVTKSSNIRIVGTVPISNEVLRSARFGVYPVLSRTGIQNKILEAWANGLPVITTMNALNVFRAYDNSALGAAICARSGQDFVNAMKALEMNQKMCIDIIRCGRELTLRYFNWPCVSAQLLSVFINCYPVNRVIPF